MNSSSTEEAVRSDALAREKEVLSKRIVELETVLVASRKAASEKDKMLAFLEKKADSANRYYQELKEVRAKFAMEKKTETEDTVVLALPALVYRIEELERNLVGAAHHGFDNASDQLNGVEFRVDGIHFLKYV